MELIDLPYDTIRIIATYLYGLDRNRFRLTNKVMSQLVKPNVICYDCILKYCINRFYEEIEKFYTYKLYFNGIIANSGYYISKNKNIIKI